MSEVQVTDRRMDTKGCTKAEEAHHCDYLKETTAQCSMASHEHEEQSAR